MKKLVAVLSLSISLCLLSAPFAFANSLGKSNIKQEIFDAKKATGQEEYFNYLDSLDPELVKKLYIHEDGTVTSRDNNVDESFVKEFEQKLKAYTSKIAQHNKQLGIISDGLETDGSGNISISSGGGGKGRNSITTDGLVKGDIMLLNDPGTSLQGNIDHAGMYDGTKDDNCIYTAQPGEGVKWERVSHWRGHDEAWGLEVTGVTTSTKANAFDQARSAARLGETYYWYAGKGDHNSWYCSKIPWHGYSALGTEIDTNGGYWVTPDDLYMSHRTGTIKYST
ncbi:hypothetical protein [Paenibacillus sp. 481]|uniref:hypothetical protein n=1 Tax=Paenibacillus sp. 481 TaxID=2835869 RepID=UPI001E500C70|nr:hypothetical protein [Paenibacillus sp. 481]UHA75607.1 hypothetical protein KIK04_11800 [Paenibacillus sp. 481]